VLDPLVWEARRFTSEATVTGLQNCTGGPCSALPSAALDLDFDAVPIGLREDITNCSPGKAPGDIFVPGDIACVNLDVLVSDYFDFENLLISTTLGDPLTYLDGTATTAPEPDGDGDARTLEFVVPDQFGDAATTFSIEYRVRLEEFYDSGDPVLAGDVIPTTNRLSGNILAPPAITPAFDIADILGEDSVFTAPAVFEKHLVAIDGVPVDDSGPTLQITPGQVATWQLLLEVNQGDSGDIVFTDYFPQPVFWADEHGGGESGVPTLPVIGAVGADPASFPFRYGPATNLADPGCVVTSVTGRSATNAVTIECDPFDDTSVSTSTVIELLLDVTLVSAPFEDGLTFTNLALASSEATATITSATLVAPIEVLQPELHLQTGALAAACPTAACPNTVFSAGNSRAPAPIDGAVWSSTSLQSLPVNADVFGADAGDVISYAVVVENRGSHAAYDIAVRVAPNADLVEPAGGWNLRVSNGAGDPVALLPGTPDEALF
jgi:hypothetical protein